MKLLLVTNHLAIDDISGTQTPLMPMPTITPKNKYSCQILLNCDINKKPKPIRNPQIVTTNLGPNLSVSPPTTIPITPYIIMDSEKAPEIIALVQPKSANNGLKKRPKALCGPNDTTKIKKEIITTM